MAKLGQLGELVNRKRYGGRTDLLVLQGTPFCNLDCTYCYLPSRDDKRRMSHETVAAAGRWMARAGLAAKKMTVVWHAGEPMVLPRDWYARAIDILNETLGKNTKITHAFQTNGVLVNEEWCRFFRDHKIKVGVSMDGPAVIHDAHRLTRSQIGTFKSVIKGYRLLAHEGLDPTVIAVVSKTTLRHKDAFIRFFDDLNPRQLGLNFEEQEGENATSTLDTANDREMEQFLTKLVGHALRTGRPRLREMEAMIQVLRYSGKPRALRHQENTPFRIVTIDADGGFHTFSPELAGAAVANFDGSPFGNVFQDSLSDILADPRFRDTQREIDLGVAMCAQNCKYFRICGGGGPSNKLGESGRFDIAETRHCQISMKLLSEVILSEIEQSLRKDTGKTKIDLK